MFILAVMIEIFGIAVVGTGIGLELAHGGSVYMMIITAGSCVIAGGGLLFNKVVKRK